MPKTKVECYKCEAEVEVEDEYTVHPLCADCQTSFEDWFNEQLRAFTK